MTSCMLPRTIKPFKKGSSLKGGKNFNGRNYFLLEVTPMEKAGKHENGRVVSPETT